MNCLTRSLKCLPGKPESVERHGRPHCSELYEQPGKEQLLQSTQVRDACSQSRMCNELPLSDKNGDGNSFCRKDGDNEFMNIIASELNTEVRS